MVGWRHSSLFLRHVKVVSEEFTTSRRKAQLSNPRQKDDSPKTSPKSLYCTKIYLPICNGAHSISRSCLVRNDCLVSKYFSYVGLAYFLPDYILLGRIPAAKISRRLASCLVGVQRVADGSYTGARSVFANP